jgi:outer membrane protein assembly factor BamB
VTDGAVFAGARTGFLVSLTLGGKEMWRAALPDDRSIPGRERHDRGSTFTADAVVNGDSVLTAAHGEIIALARSNGAVRARVQVCRGEGMVVARLARVGARVIATCTARSDFDDERWTPPPLEPSPAPETRRASPGELVAFDGSLHEQWRTGVEGLSFGDGRPVALDADTFACIGAPFDRGWVSDGSPRLVVASAATGAVRWIRHLPGGFTKPEPIPVAGGVVAGSSPPTLFAAADGAVRWRAHGDALSYLEAHATPVVDGARLLYLGGNKTLVAVGLSDGTSTPVPQYSATGAIPMALGRAPDGQVLVSYEGNDGSHFARIPAAQ